jgi:hypothetical protein
MPLVGRTREDLINRAILDRNIRQRRGSTTESFSYKHGQKSALDRNP